MQIMNSQERTAREDSTNTFCKNGDIRVTLFGKPQSNSNPQISGTSSFMKKLQEIAGHHSVPFSALSLVYHGLHFTDGERRGGGNGGTGGAGGSTDSPGYDDQHR